jgi:hypothetical protein
MDLGWAEKKLKEYLQLCGVGSKRPWARYELSGYDDDVDMPSYRVLPSLPVKVDSISGNTWAKGQTFDRLQLPEAREGPMVPAPAYPHVKPALWKRLTYRYG